MDCLATRKRTAQDGARPNPAMDERTRTVVGLGGAALLVVGGTLATGYLPSRPRSQLLAGAMIVAGFALGFYVLGEFDLPD